MRRIFLISVAPVFSQSLNPGVIRVVAVEGTVHAVTEEGRGSVSSGMTLKQGSRLITSDASKVVLAFSNGAAVTLGPNTDLSIDEFLQGPGTSTNQPNPSSKKLGLRHGEIFGNIERLDDRSQFTVSTPIGTAGIRGTLFRISYDPLNQIARISTVDGDVVFEGIDGQTYQVPAGEEVTIRFAVRDDGTVEILDAETTRLPSAEAVRIIRELLLVMADHLGIPIHQLPASTFEGELLSPSR